MNKTSIEWTELTWNPLRGCSRVSEGCRHCYAERIAARFCGIPAKPLKDASLAMNAPDFPYYGFATPDGWTGRVELIEYKLTEPLRKRKPSVVFVNSMSDTFHENAPDGWLDRMFAVMMLCPQHHFLVLTKRSKRLREYWRDAASLRSRWYDVLHDSRLFPGDPRRAVLGMPSRAGVAEGIFKGWRSLMLPNVAFGVSVESRAHLYRIHDLRQIPAAMRFISLEPLLEDPGELDLTGISWVILGGESGPGARPMHPDWVRGVRDQCQAAGVPFFFKQWGEWSPVQPDTWCKVSSRKYSHETFAWGKDGQKYNALSPAPDDFPKMAYRVGKKAAGRLLDGQTWDQRPEGW